MTSIYRCSNCGLTANEQVRHHCTDRLGTEVMRPYKPYILGASNVRILMAKGKGKGTPGTTTAGGTTGVEATHIEGTTMEQPEASQAAELYTFRKGAKGEVAKIILDNSEATDDQILERSDFKAVITKYEIKNPRDRVRMARSILKKYTKVAFGEQPVAKQEDQ